MALNVAAEALEAGSILPDPTRRLIIEQSAGIQAQLSGDGKSKLGLGRI